MTTTRTAILLTALLVTCAPPLAAERSDEPDPELIALLRVAATEVDSFPDHFDAQVWLTDMSAFL